MASKHRSNEHPDSRAIMYEDTKYSTRKVRRTLQSFPVLYCTRDFFHNRNETPSQNNESSSYLMRRDAYLNSESNLVNFLLQVNDFLSVLDGLETADGFPAIFSSATVESALLRKCVISKSDGGQFPVMSSAISFFRNAFDVTPSKGNKVMKLKPGFDTVFDAAKVSGLIAKAAHQRRVDLHLKTKDRQSKAPIAHLRRPGQVQFRRTLD